MKATLYPGRAGYTNVTQTIWHLDPGIPYLYYRNGEEENRIAQWVLVSESIRGLSGPPMYAINETYIFAHPGKSSDPEWLQAQPFHWTELPGSTQPAIPAAELLTQLGYTLTQ